MSESGGICQSVSKQRAGFSKARKASVGKGCQKYRSSKRQKTGGTFPSRTWRYQLLDCRRAPRQGASCGTSGVNEMRGWLCSVALLLASPAAFAEYTFQISNNTDSKIVAVHVSEDGDTWGEFNIGSGIPAGKTAEMSWDSSTDDGSSWPRSRMAVNPTRWNSTFAKTNW
jgi:hypothetical protein